MSWKFVFNVNHKFLGGSNFDDVLGFVKTTGYKFFNFNGIIYDLHGENTGLTVKDLY